jgi:3-deoxy-manno-octulosonate cytidylyltransferase (CMP-KDO synthetase)
MVQGDEPMLFPEMIDLAVEPMLKESKIQVVNLMSKLKDAKEHQDHNQIKVVVDENNFAMYFSREPIPSNKKTSRPVPMLKQVCIIPFRRDFLIKFNELKPTPLEIAESVDMLRVLEHGYKVRMVLSKFDTYSVDTPEDLKHVEGLLAKDALYALYKDRLTGAAA